MIRVELIEKVRRRGKWRWIAIGTPLSGVSREPLLDACRKLAAVDIPTVTMVGLFRVGMSEPSLTCVVGVGAQLTVNEDGPRFQKWKARPIGAGSGWPGKSVN